MPDQETSDHVVGEIGSEHLVAPQDTLVQIKQEATVLAEAYRLRLVGRLWWANLMFVVLPAVCATAAAIFAAAAGSDAEQSKHMTTLAATLAGLAAVLSAVHKALKCEEYQAECARLGPAFEAIAILADSARASSVQADFKTVSEQFAELAMSNRAPLPDKYLTEAESRTGYKLHHG